MPIPDYCKECPAPRFLIGKDWTKSEVRDLCIKCRNIRWRRHRRKEKAK